MRSRTGSKEIELCKKDILNVLDGSKSVLSGQLKQKYYSILENEVEGLRAEISKELEDYTNNANIHKMYQSLNNKRKKRKYCNEEKVNTIVLCLLWTSGGALMLIVIPLAFLVPMMIQTITGVSLPMACMYTVLPFLVVAALALIVAGIAYLTSYYPKYRNCYLKYSFTKEMQDYIEEPKYKEMQNHIERPKCIDKATNTENAEKLKTKEEPVLVVGNLIDLDFNYDKMEDKVQLSATPLSEMKTGGLYPFQIFQNRTTDLVFDQPLPSTIQ